VLGRAHRHWRGLTDHRRYWSAYDWSELGEEWNASPEWKRALIEDVLAWWIIEGVAVLEIGPGAGRWSEVLSERASTLVLADVSERPLELCRERFAWRSYTMPPAAIAVSFPLAPAGAHRCRADCSRRLQRSAPYGSSASSTHGDPIGSMT
jgi:hypothetical protein